MNKPSIYTNDQTTLLNTLLALYNQALFDPTNTASGTTSVTLNTTSGIAEFTTTITAGTTTSLTLNSTALSATTMKINPELDYTGNGEPIILSVHSSSSGVWVIKVKNLHASQTTNAHLFIKFQQS